MFNVQHGGCPSSGVLVINYQGKTPLCCNDFLVQYGFGDLNNISVKKLWADSRPRRQRIYFAEYDLDICRNCNVPGATVPNQDEIAQAQGMKIERSRFKGAKERNDES